MSDAYPRVTVRSRQEWRSWLESNHDRSDGIWLVTFKKAEGTAYVAYPDLVEEALCFGWIDSVKRRIDKRRSRLLMTPRKPGSGWARSNKERVERLEREGAMTAAGRAAVTAAREDGSWIALGEVEALIEPADLADALDADPVARRNWDGFPPSTRRGILQWIATAKRPETRVRRIEETATQASKGIRANQWTGPKGR